MSKLPLVLLIVFPILILAISGVAQENLPIKVPVVSGGVVNGKASNLVKPTYPPAAKAVRASGAVNVQVLIDESGNVVSASAVTGHPLLRAAAVAAARASKFPPTKLQGHQVKVTGVIIYNFVLPTFHWKDAGFALGDAEVEIAETTQLNSLARDLESFFPEEGQRIRKIVDAFEENEENARKQTAAINDVINSLRQHVAASPEDAWNFELGLTLGKLKANPNDDLVLQNNLTKLKALFETIPQDANEIIVGALKELSDFADKTILTRKDKKEISELLDDLR